MIFSNIISSAISLSTQASGKLPDIAKALAPFVRDVLDLLRHEDETRLKASTVLVVIGVFLEVFEIVGELREKTGPFRFHRPEMPKWMLWAGFVGWLMIVVGVAGEFWFEGRVNTRSEELESISDALLGDAQRTSAEATKQSGDAAQSAARAKEESDAAKVSSASAAGLAQGARQEADSFANDIASAKNEAADAVSRFASAEQKLADAKQQLANATKQAVSAEEELKRLKTPRSIFNSADLIKGLRPFTGMEYTMSVAQDDEAFPLTKEIDKVLNAAGWVRKQPKEMKLGLSYLDLLGQDSKEMVPICIATGIRITVRSKESIESLQQRPQWLLPRPVQAALTLVKGLTTSILPTDEHNVDKGFVDPVPQEEGPMQICVGRKP